MAGLLHLVLHNGVGITGKQVGLKTGDPRSFKTFEDLYEAFKAQHRYFINRIFQLGAIARNEQHKYIRMPFISTVGLQASMDLGQDVLIPHPDFSMFGISDRAIIDVADSLIAVKKLIFEKKTLSMDELLNALYTNFEGKRGEEIRQMCLAAPKFGNDIDEVDFLAKDVSAYSASIIKDYDDSPFRGYMIAREGLAWHYFGGLGVGRFQTGEKHWSR